MVKSLVCVFGDLKFKTSKSFINPITAQGLFKQSLTA